MKQLHLFLMLFILLGMFSVQSYAHDIEVKNADGVTIYYKWTNSKKQLAVSFRGSKYDDYNYEYQGEIVIPEFVIYGGEKYPVTSIGGRAFSGCTSLTSISIPNSVTFIDGYAFYSCKALTSVCIPSSVTSIGNAVFADCTGLTSVDLHNGVTCIGNSAFSGCIGLTSVTIPNSVTSIDVGAFGACTGLTTITIPNSVTYIGPGVFSGCCNLTTLKVDVENRIYDSRNNCNAIIETATNKFIAACWSTKSIPDNVTSIGNCAFVDCKALSSIIIPNGVTSIGSSAFQGCAGLTSIIIPNSVSFIDGYAFSGCQSLTSIIIPNGVTSIGESTFWGCRNLTSIIIPNSVMSIDRWAFQECKGLKSITIGNSVLSIGYAAFCSCEELKEVICLAENVLTTDLNAFRGSQIQNVTLKVPETSIAFYKAQKPWSDFREIVAYSADNEAANTVIAMIKAIGKVTYTDDCKGRIDAARIAYNALTDAQKTLVKNIETLIVAEAKYLELQEMATGINVVSVDDTENILYDLCGRQFGKKPVTKGIYILNGKTLLIK